MDDLTMRLALLHHCRGIGWKTNYHILKKDPSLQSLYTPSKDLLIQELPLKQQSIKMILEDLQSKNIQNEIRQYELNEIKMISIFDDTYPQLLKETYEPPWMLYAKGNLSLLNKKKLSVVGSRQATEYGHHVIERLFPKLIDNGIVIVSGLAKGIDTLAHREAMYSGGNTIAIIGGGFYHIYPQSNNQLAVEMMKNHLILSEYPPNTRPARWHFPMRNRIISGISRGTLIIQAKSKSGSLITANSALQEGREVFAVPGNIFSPHAEGTNDLIKQGAKLVQTAEDILEELVY
ncbi:DNA-processing protein DprA [Cytobacillus purgationiresistens]|uniref:DNA processing protein n=1 Tax=Cytobacillus purgationiresistens TaxID=863449 RepID=A0ABU0AG59_9BACI|nr:DNA-processing protein DprA [Cytobacillus purgationiresistens]MDQ0270242.1 DNA processing protein [Cytobacillus purgationiresistens]